MKLKNQLRIAKIIYGMIIVFFIVNFLIIYLLLFYDLDCLLSEFLLYLPGDFITLIGYSWLIKTLKKLNQQEDKNGISED